MLANYQLSLKFQLATIKYTELLESNNIQRHLLENIPNQIVEYLTCKYYDEESLNYTTSHINWMLYLIHLKLKVFKAHLDSVKHYLIDTITMSETGLKNVDTVSNIFPGYTFLSNTPTLE